MWRDPVTLGGGMTSENTGRPSPVEARKMLESIHHCAQCGSNRCGSYTFSICMGRTTNITWCAAPLKRIYRDRKQSDGTMTTTQAILRGVCPRCRQGRIFAKPMWRGILAMHERCPVCGLKFDRESGYFLGAMYFSYLLMAVPAVVVYLWISRHTPWASDWMLLWTALITLPLVP